MIMQALKAEERIRTWGGSVEPRQSSFEENAAVDSDDCSWFQCSNKVSCFNPGTGSIQLRNLVLGILNQLDLLAACECQMSLELGILKQQNSRWW